MIIRVIGALCDQLLGQVPSLAISAAGDEILNLTLGLSVFLGVSQLSHYLAVCLTGSLECCTPVLQIAD